MEAHWKTLLREIQSRDHKVVFLELQNLVETAGHTAENLPPCCYRGLTIPDPSDHQTTPIKSESETDDIPTAEEWERTMSEGHEAVTIMDPGERNIAIPRGPPQINPALSLPNPRLDKDERAGLRRLTETFESVRSKIAMAWNRAMIWIDDKVVFARLNTLLTVTKEATDGVIEAALRAEKNAADTFKNVLADRNGLTPNDVGRQHETNQESVKRVDTKQTYQTCPQPLPTRDGSFLPARRVHVRGKDPQPDVEEAVPRRTKVGQPVVVKKIETQLLSSASHSDC